ncbi:amidase [Nitratireductor sp. XY-223]|uniref:amidase n=1 Tax=Nitratireductor sp. XY-223 TaxID=2561926 RepID=UPI0010A9EB4F|nr:amidase [Nitratireductor sp. XY-223]
MQQDLTFHSATKLAGMISRREISCFELTRAYCDRISEINTKLNAAATLRLDAALDDARAADDALARGKIRGPLHGIPITIKDSLETEGLVTTAGTRGLIANIPDKDATVVARLKSAGAILLGKSNTPEITLKFVTDNHVFGRTNNPYDVARSPAGSSGGAAALVAAGGATFDIGTDYGGSIRMPAHFCGIAGLKPTSGRVPRTGHIPFLETGASEAFIAVGPMTRKVEDLGLILKLISGADGRDPMVVPAPLGNPDEVALEKLRVAHYTDNGITAPTTETAATLNAAASSLKDMVASVIEDRPPGIETSPDLWMRLVLADGGRGIVELLARLGTEEMHPLLEWTQGREAMSTKQYFDTLTEWNRLRSDCLAFLERYDVVLSPVCATPATLHDDTSPLDYSYFYNLLGWPVAVVRCGTSPEGLPIGVQVAAKPWREDLVLAVAKQLEDRFGGWQQPPL